MHSNLKSTLAVTALLGALFPATVLGATADGAPCKIDGDCTSGYCDLTTDPTKPVCATKPAAKAADGATCATDAECDSGFCDGTPAVCSAQADVGQACTRNEACSSTVCLKGKCVACASDSDCVGTGEKCLSNECKIPPGSVADGDPCPQGTALVTLPDGTLACVPVLQAPPPTAPVPATQPAPAPISLETVCGSFPLSDPASNDAFDHIAGCVWMATAQACGASRGQFWGDCALKAQSLSKGKAGPARVQSFYATGLGLVVEKYSNRLSGRFKDAAALAALTGDLGALAAALKGTAAQGDLLRLALGGVTAGSRTTPRRAPAPVAAPPTCPAGWTLLATTKSPVFGSTTGEWLCHRSGEEGPGSWREPDYPTSSR
ncbi:hypothetical protein HY604_04530 [Candidatus Peregrinibacteria bacterium]|nr:hypothetical protein [Candidatus Peregrinibacteria bacterium]